jgi:SAM-dependent methyltransferase
MSRYIEMFKDYVWNIPANGSLNVLVVGCGRAVEAYYLNEYFSGNARFLCVDIDDKELYYAKENLIGIDARIKKHNAARLNEVTDESFDLVISRHPDISSDPLDLGNWEGIYNSASERMAPGATLVVTTYTPKEIENVLMVMKKLRNMKIGPIERNKHSLAINAESGLDGYILTASSLPS